MIVKRRCVKNIVGESGRTGQCLVTVLEIKKR